MNIYDKPEGVQSRWSSFENPTTQRAQAALTNKGQKGNAFEPIMAHETKTLLDVEGSGVIHRIWLTVTDRNCEILRSLKMDIFWDKATKPAVSVPLGDFFGISLGRRTPFECALFSDPEGRSFNCFIQMPFRHAARVTITNQSEKNIHHLFYDINLSLGVKHSQEMRYFHSHWRREAPNTLGKDFDILPAIKGSGRFLGCNIGVIANPIYQGAWWGEGEAKVWFGNDKNPTLCGTGAEDYLGTAWGQGAYANRTQGCPIADNENKHWCFYRYHIDDPIYFDDGCRVAIQTIGGTNKQKVTYLQNEKVPLIPVSINQADAKPFLRLMEHNENTQLSTIKEDGWCNFLRQDDWSATAYFYHDSAEGLFPELPDPTFRCKNLITKGDATARNDT